MTSYPTEPTGNNEIDLTNIFALNATNKIVMSTEEILEGYNNDGEASTPLTSTPDGNKFNYFWYQVHNTLAWVVNYIKALYDNKLELSGGIMSGALAMGSQKVTTTYTPVDNADLANKLYVDTAVSGSMWLSEIKYLSYSTIPTLPTGMEVVMADGRAISRSTYSTLFALIGTTYGVGDNSATFNIPDLRGVVARGWDNGRGLDPSRVFGSYQTSGAPNITGTTGANDDAIGGLSGAFYFNGYSGSEAGGPGQQLNVGFDASRVSSEYQSISEVRMKNIALYPVIRIK